MSCLVSGQVNHVMSGNIRSGRSCHATSFQVGHVMSYHVMSRSWRERISYVKSIIRTQPGFVLAIQGGSWHAAQNMQGEEISWGKCLKVVTLSYFSARGLILVFPHVFGIQNFEPVHNSQGLPKASVIVCFYNEELNTLLRLKSDIYVNCNTS